MDGWFLAHSFPGRLESRVTYRSTGRAGCNSSFFHFSFFKVKDHAFASQGHPTGVGALFGAQEGVGRRGKFMNEIEICRRCTFLISPHDVEMNERLVGQSSLAPPPLPPPPHQLTYQALSKFHRSWSAYVKLGHGRRAVTSRVAVTRARDKNPAAASHSASLERLGLRLCISLEVSTSCCISLPFVYVLEVESTFLQLHVVSALPACLRGRLPGLQKRMAT